MFFYLSSVSITVHTVNGDETIELNEIASIDIVTDDMVFVEGGTFTMGDPFNEGDYDEYPLHEVTVSSFYMCRYEVTNSNFIEFLNSYEVDPDGSYNGTELIDIADVDCAIDHNGTEFYFGGSIYISSENCPLLEETWYGAVVYCNWKSEQEGLTPCYDLTDWSCDFEAVGYRLPTEAEWEYAGRGGIHHADNYRYCGCHNTFELTNYCWFSSNNNPEGVKEVGTKFPNQLGLYDMSGNAGEWCWDWYGTYSGSPQTDPHGPAGGLYRVQRSGLWGYSAFSCRVANRAPMTPETSNNCLGFRVCRAYE